LFETKRAMEEAWLLRSSMRLIHRRIREFSLLLCSVQATHHLWELLSVPSAPPSLGRTDWFLDAGEKCHFVS
jgi:hypothetical protein